VKAHWVEERHVDEALAYLEAGVAALAQRSASAAPAK
jgi:hypothetical protein